MKILKPLTHKPNPGGWKPDHRRGNRHQRGYGIRWERLRAHILKRDDYLCQPCRLQGRTTPAAQVDHIRPKAFGGTDDPENLQSICAECHRIKTSKESLGRGGTISRG